MNSLPLRSLENPQVGFLHNIFYIGRPDDARDRLGEHSSVVPKQLAQPLSGGVAFGTRNYIHLCPPPRQITNTLSAPNA
jgi:hypothetical protein